ncbi:MAG: hypothetical protein WC340_06510 [Kiritimatiellia bacterium]
MKKMLLFFAVAGIIPSAFAANHLIWKSANHEGWFNEQANWSNSEFFETGGADNFFRFSTAESNGGDYTLYMSDYAMQGALHAYIWKTSTLVFDGAGAVFELPASESGAVVNNTGYDPFTIRSDGYNIGVAYLSAANTTSAAFCFTNIYMKIGRTATDGRLTWDLIRGYFSFAEPGGTNTAHTFNLAAYSGKGNDLRMDVAFSNVTVRLPQFNFRCYPSNNSFTVSSGICDIMGALSFDTTSALTYPGTNTFLVTEGAQVTQHSGAFNAELTANAGVRFDQFVVTGEGTRFSAAGASSVNFLGTSSLSVSDGAEAIMPADKIIAFGTASGDRPELVVSGTGTLFNARSSQRLELNIKTAVTVSDGAELRLPRSSWIGGKSSADEVTFTVRDDGTQVTVMTNNTGLGGFYVGNQAGSKAVFNMEGGTFGGVTDQHSYSFYLGNPETSSGTVNLSGGTIHVGPVNSLYIGMTGNGTMNISGGELYASTLINLGYRSPSTPQTSRYNQTGGYVYAKNGLYACANSNTANRTADIVLDGGLLETTLIYGSKTQAAGGLGTGRFYADGGRHTQSDHHPDHGGQSVHPLS